MAEEESKWKEAEIRRDDIKALLENTKKLAGMYGDLLQIKREGWENVLKARAKKAEKEKQNG
tara:strand:- start:323 stop:508 length:186 start_codon:yes stop_codon:yes gene_type:complete